MPSTVIRYMHYDPQTAVLKVTFVTGRKYEYLSVPEAVYMDLKNAFSKGQYFNQHIRGHYDFREAG